MTAPGPGAEMETEEMSCSAEHQTVHSELDLGTPEHETKDDVPNVIPDQQLVDSAFTATEGNRSLLPAKPNHSQQEFPHKEIPTR